MRNKRRKHIPTVEKDAARAAIQLAEQLEDVLERNGFTIGVAALSILLIKGLQRMEDEQDMKPVLGPLTAYLKIMVAACVRNHAYYPPEDFGSSEAIQ